MLCCTWWQFVLWKHDRDLNKVITVKWLEQSRKHVTGGGKDLVLTVLDASR